MAFKFKDLMVQVINDDGEPCTCGPATRDPAAATPCTCGPETRPMAAAIVPCTVASAIDPAGIICGAASAGFCGAASAGACGAATAGFRTLAAITTVTTVTTVTTLVGGAGPHTDFRTLKEQLRQALDDLERQEAGAQGAGLPATAEEADDLERRLKEAIEELQDHKKTLRKGAAKKAKAPK